MSRELCPRCQGRGKFEDPLDDQEGPILCPHCQGADTVRETTDVDISSANRERKP